MVRIDLSPRCRSAASLQRGIRQACWPLPAPATKLRTFIRNSTSDLEAAQPRVTWHLLGSLATTGCVAPRSHGLTGAREEVPGNSWSGTPVGGVIAEALGVRWACAASRN